MNAKILKYIVLIVFILLWLPGFSPTIARWIFEKGLVKDDYRYGDLYRFSNLPQFRTPNQNCVQEIAEVTRTNMALYLIGDSFTNEGKIKVSDFITRIFYRFHINDKPFIKLDKTKKNVLIIEIVERNFRERFANPYLSLTIDSTTAAKTTEKIANNNGENFGYNTERHLTVLFSSNFFLSIKEWKATLNERFFGRINKNTVLSKDEKNIFYALDASQKGIWSSFDKISDKEIRLLVKNVNLTYDFYKKNGFDEVYLTIAPNKSSILGTDLGKYNHLIERIQKNPALQMAFFDVYTPLSTSKKMLYDVGDTHWNCDGKQIWVNAVNQKL